MYYSSSSSGIVNMVRSAGSYPPELENAIVSEINSCLRQCPTLIPRVDILASPGAPSINLISLSGTIPIHYRGGSYNIPVKIWVTQYHPHTSPIAMVTPTESMMIKPRHRHVDTAGRVYLPYLSEWKSNTQKNLEGLVAVMASIFSQDPPVYARPPSAQPPPSQPPIPTGSPPSQSSFAQKPPKPTLYASPANSQLIFSQMVDKTKLKLDELYIDTQVRMKALEKEKDELGSGHKAIEEGIKAVSIERDAIERRVAALEKENEELQSWISANESNHGEIPLDEILVPQDTASKQLLDCVSEDLAIQDALYLLDDAYDRGVIDINDFLKEIRKQARDQFMIRCLLRKVKFHIANQQRSTGR